MKYWRHLEEDLGVWPAWMPDPPDDPEKWKGIVAAILLFGLGVILIVIGCL